MRSAWGLVLAIALATPAAARPTPDAVRVGLYRHAPPAVMDISAEGAWEALSGAQRLRLKPGAALVLRADGSRVVAVRAGRPMLSGPELRLIAPSPWRLTVAGVGPRRFEGALRVKAERGRLVPVLSTDLEAYAAACTGDEMPADWPRAALEAQAIASRGYALANRDRHGSDGFDVCDLTHCQRYRGLAGADPRVSAAAAATRGQALHHRGRPVAPIWHAACGGHRASNEVVFGGVPQPVLRGGFDGPPGGPAWCREAQVNQWAFEAEHTRVERALRAARVLNASEPLTGLAVTHRTAGGYAATVRVEGTHARAMTGYALWLAMGPHFGWGDVKSPAFTVRRVGTRWRFEGHGLGHGVGMCQWGARGQALAGRTARQILGFYFPGTELR